MTNSEAFETIRTDSGRKKTKDRKMNWKNSEIRERREWGKTLKNKN